MKQFASITYLFVLINAFNHIFCNPLQLKSICIDEQPAISTNSNFDLSLVSDLIEFFLPIRLEERVEG
jgi:hypothetical protein